MLPTVKPTTSARAHPARLGHEADERCVPQLEEVPSFAGFQQLAQVLDRHDRNGLLGHGWRAHRGHRIGVDKPITNGPAVELLQRPVADGSGSGGAVLEQVRDEPTRIVGGRVERFRTVEEVDQHPRGLGVGADGGTAAVLGAQGVRPFAQHQRVGIHRR
jgi:hypothetical protein